MAFFDKKLYSEGLHNNKQPDKKAQTHHAVKKAIQADPDSYSKESNPVTEQAKQKLSTSAKYKAVFAQGGLFKSNVTNLSADDLFYIIDDTTAKEYHRLYGNNIEKALEEDDGYRHIKDKIPKYLYGGGENDLLPLDGIDFKKTYNAEAKIAEY